MTTRLLLLASTLALTAAACGKDDSADKAAGKPAAGKPAAIDLAAVNAAVPAGLDLRFETATIDDEVEAVVPVGWTASKYIPGSYDPPADADLGFFTKFKIGSNCDGLCEPKDWPPIIEKVELANPDGAEILRDDTLANGRLVILKGSDRTRVVAVWWKADSRQYFYCRAELDGKAAQAVDAFEQACRQSRVIGW